MLAFGDEKVPPDSVSESLVVTSDDWMVMPRILREDGLMGSLNTSVSVPLFMFNSELSSTGFSPSAIRLSTIKPGGSSSTGLSALPDMSITSEELALI